MDCNLTGIQKLQVEVNDLRRLVLLLAFHARHDLPDVKSEQDLEYFVRKVREYR